MNTQAMSLLTMIKDAPKMIQKVKSVKGSDWSGGDDWKLVQSLLKKYKPSNMIAVPEQTSKLISLKLKRSKDPEDLGDSMPVLQMAYESSIDKKQKIAAIVKTYG